MNQPLWPSGEPKGWRKHIDAWGDDLRALAKDFPSLDGIYERHLGLLEGKGIDVAEAEERITAWRKRRGKKDPRRKPRLKKKNDKESDTPEKETDEPAAVDRRGAATSTPDAPTTDDRLGRKPLVQSLAAMFAAREQATPFTLALLGDWGAGKSSVMEQLKEELAPEQDRGGALEFLFATFNAWQYKHTDDIRAGLAQEVVNGLTQGLGFWERRWLTFRFAWTAHRSELVRTLWGLGFTLFVVSALVLVASRSSSQVLQSVLGLGAAGGVVAFIVVSWKNVRTILNHPLATQLQTYLKLPDYGKHLGAVPVMKKHIETLCELRAVKRENATRRLVVFVDDLDRCSHECITQTFDAVRLVMEIPNVIVVVAIDYRIAFAAVAKHYANLAGSNRSEEAIARDYLGKIIQLPVELPRPSSMQSFIQERLFRTVDKDEVDTLSRRPDLQSSDEKLDALIREREESEVAPESTTRTRGKPGASPVSGEVASASGPRGSKPRPPTPEMMPETAMDCRLFEKWTSAFKFNNPRQLIRLRNTYRLLTQLDHALDHESSDEVRMAMLFWLEFLYQKPIKEQKQYQDRLVPPGDTEVDGKSSPERDRMEKEITEFGIREFLLPALGDSFDERCFEYERLKQHIGRFVLRFGGESPPNSD